MRKGKVYLLLALLPVFAQAQGLERPAADAVLLTDTTGLLFDYEFETPKGEMFRFSPSNDKVVLIDFWATWCKGCIQAQPEVDRLIQKLGRKNAEVVYASIDENVAAWKKYTKSKPWRGEHILVDKEKHASFYRLLNVSLGAEGKIMTGVIIPQYYLLSKTSQLLETTGPDETQLEKDLLRLMKE